MFILRFLIFVVALSVIFSCDNSSSPTGSIPVLDSPSRMMTISGDGVELYKKSVENMRKNIQGSQLNDFNEAISFIEFVLKDAAYIELKGKNVDQVIASRKGIEDLYIAAFNAELLGVYASSIKIQSKVMNEIVALIDKWNVYAPKERVGENDLQLALSLEKKVRSLSNKEGELLAKSDLNSKKINGYKLAAYSESQSATAQALVDAVKKDNSDLEFLLKEIDETSRLIPSEKNAKSIDESTRTDEQLANSLSSMKYKDGEVICKYQAKISVTDRSNSAGKVIADAPNIDALAASVRQDRANFYVFNKRDIEDTNDCLFSNKSNREKIREMILNSNIGHDVVIGALAGKVISVTVYKNKFSIDIF